MKAKKYLGQNFLTRPHYGEVMRNAAKVDKNDFILEIGPGKGILTAVLLAQAKKVIALEKDRELVEYLKEKYSKEIKNKKLELIDGDALNYKLPTFDYKLIANIPYYITGEILRHFLETKKQPLSMTLMVQKEVAERIVARDSKESILSLSVKAYGVPKIIARVGAGNFQPKPKVDSAILHIEGISRNFFKDISEENFFKIIKAGFAHKRKKLVGNLSEAGFNRARVEKILTKEKMSPNARAEDLTLADWKKITMALHA